jgi:hypothetical protein
VPKSANELYSRAGQLLGLRGGGGSNTDSATLNYSLATATPMKLVTDVEVQGKFGAGQGLACARARDCSMGHQNNGGGRGGLNSQLPCCLITLPARSSVGSPVRSGTWPRATLNHYGFAVSKFSGVYLLDAYAYRHRRHGPATAARQTVRVKRIHQGINQINPIDVTALCRPGTEVKEVLPC